jgi:hypothetical protein
MTPEQNVIIWARGMLGEEFVWGVTDCAMLALKGLDVLTGESYAARYLGKWTGEDEALAHFKTELPSQVLAGFGGIRVLNTFAVLGDVIAVPAGIWPEQMHFVLGAKSLSSDPAKGVHLLPTRLLTELPDATVWRVAQCLKPSP